MNVGDPEEIFLPSLSGTHIFYILHRFFRVGSLLNVLFLLEEERAKLGSGNVIKMKAQKPSFEVGASQPLSFAKKPQVPVPKVRKVLGTS